MVLTMPESQAVHMFLAFEKGNMKTPPMRNRAVKMVIDRLKTRPKEHVKKIEGYWKRIMKHALFDGAGQTVFKDLGSLMQVEKREIILIIKKLIPVFEDK